MVELAYTTDLKSVAFGIEGSSPSSPTILTLEIREMTEIRKMTDTEKLQAMVEYFTNNDKINKAIQMLEDYEKFLKEHNITVSAQIKINGYYFGYITKYGKFGLYVYDGDGNDLYWTDTTLQNKIECASRLNELTDQFYKQIEIVKEHIVDGDKWWKI